ncbi:hypothetical protein EBS57_02375 [bacterium]|nr:hypothetical protein [bacterium]
MRWAADRFRGGRFSHPSSPPRSAPPPSWEPPGRAMNCATSPTPSWPLEPFWHGSLSAGSSSSLTTNIELSPFMSFWRNGSAHAPARRPARSFSSPGPWPAALGSTWRPSFWSFVLVALTAVYTAVGGIKAVVWTDVIQACVMFSGLGYVIWHLAKSIPGGLPTIHGMLQGPDDLSFWNLGPYFQGDLWATLKAAFETEYTIWTAFFAATFVTMATHGTDQDMVQRMLTAKNPARSRLALVASGLADLPIVLAFLSIGILLWVFYQRNPDPHLPARNAHVFAYYILSQLPPGLRGLLVAGIFATAMGSLSTALNALATSWVRDWYEPFFAPRLKNPDSLRAARWSTVTFAGILVLVGGATAWVVISNPASRILPIVLGVFGYTYGSLLGIFLLGALTKNRGSDTGNLVAMAAGFVAVAVLSGLPSDLLKLFGLPPLPRPDWLPLIAFPWRITFGTLTTFFVAYLFPAKS